MKFARAVLVALSLLVASIATAQAHTRSQSFSTWRIDGPEVVVTFSVAAREVTRLPAPEPGLSQALASVLGRHLVTQLRLSSDGAACPQTGPPIPVGANEGQIVLELRFRCSTPPASELTITDDALFPVVLTHVHFAHIVGPNNRSRELVFVDARRTQTISLAQGEAAAETFFDAVVTCIPIGIDHILEGIDHLAFVLGLILATARLRSLLLALTGFTLGHSISLALAVLGYARADAPAIEAMIAATIALVAVAAALRDGASFRTLGIGAIATLSALAIVGLFTGSSLPWLAWLGLTLFAGCYLAANTNTGWSGGLALLVTTLFGIIHGFGFAGALLELELPKTQLAAALLGFNLGVEAGQILAVVPVILIGGLVARYASLQMQSAARNLLQAALVGLGLFWFVSRALF